MRHVSFEPPDAGRGAAQAGLVDRVELEAPETGGDHDHEDAPELAAAVGHLLARARADGADAVTIEAEPVSPALAAAVQAAGLELVRTTLQLRRSLPIQADVRGHAPDIVTRAFRVGTDDAAWLALNNRAFAWHPDQSERTRADLAALQAERWFRPDGFLVHEGIDGALDGFCWTKIHAGHHPPLGEIYVIGVDPHDHGRGLGRALVLAGLDWLASQGLTEAMLYVEADNEPARHLYRSLGFTEHHAHQWWRRVLGGPDRSPPDSRR